MKVLLVSHTCMSRVAGQPRLHRLAAYPDVELTALVPHRMRFYEHWEEAEPPANAAFRYVVGRARGQSVLGKWYLQHYPDALARVLRETQPDILNLWHEPWSLVCAQAIGLARRLCPQAKIIIETEQNIYKRLPPPFAQFQNYSLRHADLLIARSQEAVEVARRKGYAGAIRVVPNAVDCDLFCPPSPEARRRQRRALRWAENNTFVIGYAGRLSPEKGLTDALNALAFLPETFHLMLAGEGTMRAELESCAQNLDLASRVHFTGGVPMPEMPNFLAALDVLILPSRTTPSWKEQFGRVLIEAGASGLPVVGSNSGAIPEVIAEAGLVFPEGDHAALAECLRRLHDDAKLRVQLGSMGRQRAVAQFSWERVAATMRGLYQEALGVASSAEQTTLPLATAAAPDR